MYSLDTEEEARQLIVLTCGTTMSGEHYARELAHEQTLPNLRAFSDRLARAHEWMQQKALERNTTQEKLVAAESIPLVDHRGTDIEAGKRVAYNFSGEIAMGEVVSARGAYRKDSNQSWTRAEIKVRVIAPKRHQGHISTVRDAKNVLVLFEKD